MPALPIAGTAPIGRRDATTESMRRGFPAAGGVGISCMENAKRVFPDLDLVAFHERVCRDRRAVDERPVLALEVAQNDRLARLHDLEMHP